MTYADFKAELEAAKENSSQCQRILQSIRNGRAAYSQAAEYSQIVGKLASDILQRLLGDSFTGMSWQEALQSIFPSMCLVYEDVTGVTADLQTAMNQRAGISLNGKTADTNKSRIFNMMEKMSNEDEDSHFLIEEGAVENFARSAVNDTLEKNAEIQADAGLESWIERIPDGGCCEWCQTMGGRYKYGEQPADFFQVHKDCSCTIEFHPAKSRAQRITYTTTNGRRSRTISDI